MRGGRGAGCLKSIGRYLWLFLARSHLPAVIIIKFESFSKKHGTCE
jgi:hypothetical protein